jgi:hypothetical protein
MKARTMGDKAASVRARLLNLSKEQRSDFNQILVRYALERLLYRLGVSQHSDRFLLKGALLFTLWYDMPHRPTRDADFLGFGDSDHDSIAETFREILALQSNDGVIFDLESLKVSDIRKEAGYPGVRVEFIADIARAICRIQVDIGFGDAVTPEPAQSQFPTMLADMDAPNIRTYPTYTVIAEKLHAITVLGMANSRMKDYFDLRVILEKEALDSETMKHAIAATFERRQTTMARTIPIGLTEEFASDASKQSQWAAFLQKNGLAPMSLDSVVTELRKALAIHFQA